MTEWWDEDPELLGATLGLLAAWDGDAMDINGRPAYSPPSPPLSDSSHGTSAASTSKRSINVSRERRKQELQFLRNKVADMQSQLHQLRDRREEQLRPHFRDAQQTQLATVAPVWENMSTRQFQARKRSELLNAKLKTTLAAQMRVAQDLIRVIQLAEQRSRAAGPSILPAPRVPIDVSQLMSEEEQLVRLCTLRENWASEFARRPEFAGDSSGTLQFLDMRVVDDSGDDTVIELFSSSVLPFPVARVEEAMWSIYLEDGGEDEQGDVFTQEATATDDLIIAVFSCTMSLDSGLRGSMHGKFMTERFHPVPNQTNFVAHTQSEPQGFANQLDGVTTFEDSWIRLVDAKELGHTQLSGPLTIIQHVRRERIVLSPSVDPDSSRSRMETVTQITMKQIRDEIEWAQGMLENVLMSAGDRIKPESL